MEQMKSFTYLTSSSVLKSIKIINLTVLLILITFKLMLFMMLSVLFDKTKKMVKSIIYTIIYTNKIQNYIKTNKITLKLQYQDKQNTSNMIRVCE